MQFTERSNSTRWFIIISSFLIVLLILWNTYNFFQIFKNEERNKMELWANAQKTLVSTDESEYLNLILFIQQTNTTIPIIVTNDNDEIITFANIDEPISNDSIKLDNYLKDLKTENKPIQMENQLLYYANSPLLTKLKYYPIALFLIILLFGAVVYNFYRATKMSTQNKLWAGMAKETAHQIGTPLSSLIGWLEILKLDNVEPSTIE